MTEAPGGPASHSDESVLHWRTLRESLETRIGRLETDLRGFRADSPLGIGSQVPSAERRFERLLRLQRLHAKLFSRERLAVGGNSSAPDPSALHRA